MIPAEWHLLKDSKKIAKRLGKLRRLNHKFYTPATRKLFEHIDCKDLLCREPRTELGRKIVSKGTLQVLFDAGLAHHVRAIRIVEADERIGQDYLKTEKENYVEEWIVQRIAHWAMMVHACCDKYSNVRALRLPPFIPIEYSHGHGNTDEMKEIMSSIVGEQMVLPVRENCCIDKQPTVIKSYCDILSRLQPSLQHLTVLQLDMTFCQLERIMKSEYYTDPTTERLAKFLINIQRLRIEFPGCPKPSAPAQRTAVHRVRDTMTVLITQPELRSKPCNHHFIALACLVDNHAHNGNPIHHLEVASPDLARTDRLDEPAEHDHSMVHFLLAFGHLKTIELRILEFHSISMEKTIRANKNTLQEIAIKTCGLLSGAWGPILLAIKEVPNLLECTLVGLNMTGEGYRSLESSTTSKLKLYPELCSAMNYGFLEDYDTLVELHSVLKARNSKSRHGVTERYLDPDPRRWPRIGLRDGARPEIISP